MRTGLPAPPEDPLGPYGGAPRGPWGAQRAPKGPEAGAREIRTRALSEGLPRAPRSPGSRGLVVPRAFYLEHPDGPQGTWGPKGPWAPCDPRGAPGPGAWAPAGAGRLQGLPGENAPCP